MRTQNPGAVLTLRAALFAGLCAGLCAGLFAIFPASAWAQVVWRCGSEGGRTYSDIPCPGGQALAFQDRRQASDATAAWADVRRQQAWAQAAAQEREIREARALAMSSQAANLGPATAGAAAAGHTVKPSVKPKAKRQARRQTQLQLHRQPTSAAETEDGGTWRATAPASRRTKG